MDGMGSPVDPQDVRDQIEEVIEIWLEYDATADPSVFDDTDLFAEDIVEKTCGEAPIVGKEAVIEYLDTLDPTEWEWDYTIDEIVAGRDLVVTRFTVRGRENGHDAPDPEEVVISSVDAFRRQDDGTLKQFLSAPSPNS